MTIVEQSVLVVDDEDDMRALVRAIIQVANHGLSVAGEAPDGETAVAMCRELRPQVVLLDQRMPGATGLETAERILAENPGQTIVLFSAYIDQGVVRAAERLGVHSCLSKRDVHDLADALWALAPERGTDNN